MPLKLENVRLTPYNEIEAIPDGFKISGEFKTRRGPSPMQYNWYSRHDSVQHEVFHLLAVAPTDKPEGYTVEELKALYTNDADKAKVDEIINKFKGSWDHRHTGFDLVQDVATGTHFMLIWRDPRKHYAKEIGVEGDHSAVPHQKTPTYVEKVPQLLEEARNPKPVVEKAARAPRAEGAPKTSKKATEVATSTAPQGGYMLAFEAVPATMENLEGTNIREILQSAVAKFVDANTLQVATGGDDPAKKVLDTLLVVIDTYGLDSGFIDYVAKYQKEGAIKAGFYRICKELSLKYLAHKAAAATATPPPPAAATTVTAQEVAAQ